MMHVSLIQPIKKKLKFKNLKICKVAKKKHNPPMSIALACLANVHCLFVPLLT